MTITLDHIVILVSPQVLSNLPSWLTSAFTIINGGRHSNGITENKLILFQDGVYIELIAFVQGTSPDDRASTRWGRRNEGQIVDFALTLLSVQGDESFDPESAFRKSIQHRVRDSDVGLQYSDPIAGGRVTPEGNELKWAVAVPQRATDGTTKSIEGQLPFWCLDRTPRDFRVPFRAGSSVTDHNCGATGFRAVEVFIDGDEGDFEKLKTVYNSFLGGGLVKRNEEDASQTSASSWKLEVPATVLQGSRHDSLPTVLTLRDSKQEGQGTDDLHQDQRREETSNAGESVRISLVLYTSGPSSVLSGEIGPARILDIELVHV